ncbi:MAG: sensor domain-containing diguanylate cyclase [Fusobacterium sp.]|nr:sensor domain-containing diguanylate cyclase [Fusobacterium sp.]
MLQKIAELSKLLNSSYSAKSILNSLHDFFVDYFGVQKTELYTWDSTTSQLRDFSRNWLYIDDIFEKKVVGEYYKIHDEFEAECPYKSMGGKLYFPLKKQAKFVGMLEFTHGNDEELLKFLEVAADVISLKVQNIILNEKMQKNINFHDSMKNIAKIIETQYELNYIVPLIGEMFDKFVSNHLIYIFLKKDEDEEFSLVWPGACNDEKIYGLISILRSDSDCILTADKKTGVFPLVSEGKLFGCIVTKSMEGKLNDKEVDYIEQLTNQVATTINRANVYAEILKHATLDALTGFYNKRQLEERLKQEVSSSRRQKLPLSVIMTDIDFFKGVNDTYGHAVGDLVLKTVSDVIRSQLREYDVAGRYGGEEFTILLPSAAIKDACMVAERLRKAVEKRLIDISKLTPEHKNINVTISLGVYQMQEGDEIQDLIIKADKALYEAKTGGRNKVVSALEVK